MAKPRGLWVGWTLLLLVSAPVARTGEAVPQALSLVKVWPEKLFVRQGEAVKGTVRLANPADTPQKAQVAAWLTNGFDGQAGRQEKTVTVPAGGEAAAGFAWDGALLQPFGHAMVAEVSVAGQVVARGEDYFTSAENVWQVGIAGGHPVAFTAEHVRDLAGIERAVDRYRANYVNTFEKFFWAPDDFADMTPEKEEWYSGQARYHENLKRLKHMCDYGHRIGVLPTTYGKSIGSGPAARDFIRAHPEVVYGFGGVMSYNPDTEELAKWDEDSDPYWQSTAWANYNMNDPAVVQHGIEEIIASTVQFGWAGVRFDGHFQARTGTHRVGDRVVEFSADDADRQTAANQKALKDQVRKRFPGYVFGYNFANCVLAQRFVSQLRETVELCRDGGHIMDEYAKQNGGGNHPYRRWDDYAELMVRQAEQVRRLGGHLFPMTYGMYGIGTYQAIFTLAAGAHPNNKSGPAVYYRFATRYGELLWSPELRYIWNPLGLVVIRPGVLWENYVRELPVSETEKRLVIHLINPPLQETATETAAQYKERNRRIAERKAIRKDAAEKNVEPDFTALDSLPPVRLRPEPRTDIAVRIVPQALGAGWRAERAVCLSTETLGRKELPFDTSDPYFWQVVVPELDLWSVLVIDLVKE